MSIRKSEVKFVSAVTAGGSVKFLPAVYISPFYSFFVFFCITKTVEITVGGVKFLA